MKHRRDPFDDFFEIQKQIDRFFDTVMRGQGAAAQAQKMRPDQPLWRPPMDIYETADSFIVRVELPGIDPNEDVQIDLTDSVLTIRGARQDRSRQKKLHYHRAEINYGAFEIAVGLPDAIDTEAEIAANYQDGFLEIGLPKVAPPVARSIPIQVNANVEPNTIDAEELPKGEETE